MKGTSFKKILKLESFKTFLIGAFMGISDMIPGISGGTIALIFGIYNQFLSSLKNINLKNSSLLLKFKFKEFLKVTNFKFLFFLSSGIMFSIISFSKIINFLLADVFYRAFLFSFFLGLIVASIVLLLKKINFSWRNMLSLIFGIFLAYFICHFSFFSKDLTLNFHLKLVIAGFLAIFAMLLPGISGSFILLLLGVYPYVIAAAGNVLQKDSFFILFYLSLGILLGFVIFPKLILIALNKYHNLITSSLVGLMIGSIYVLWPFWHYKTKILSNNSILIPVSLKLPSLVEFFISFALALLGFFLFYKIKNKAEEKKINKIAEVTCI